jgi:hypothetical protein
MPDAAEVASVIHKRWRAWLRAIHRDFGYVAVGFTVIYALSGLAINHIKDWDPSFTSSEITKTIAPIGDDVPDDVAVQRVTAAVGMDRPDDVFRAGDELRLGYASGAQVTVVGDQVTIQDRSPRLFFRVANWLHYNRGKKAWTYVADVYAVMLLYLAISGIFMIKGRLGLRWRGAILVSLGIAAPAGYVVLSGGPSAHSGDGKAPTTASAPPEPVERPPLPAKTAPPARDDEPQLKKLDVVPAPPTSSDDTKLQRPQDDNSHPPPTHQNSDTGLKNPFDDNSHTAKTPPRDNSHPPSTHGNSDTGLKNPFDDSHPTKTPSTSGTKPEQGSPIDTTLERP